MICGSGSGAKLCMVLSGKKWRAPRLGSQLRVRPDTAASPSQTPPNSLVPRYPRLPCAGSVPPCLGASRLLLTRINIGESKALPPSNVVGRRGCDAGHLPLGASSAASSAKTATPRTSRSGRRSPPSSRPRSSRRAGPPPEKRGERRPCSRGEGSRCTDTAYGRVRTDGLQPGGMQPRKTRRGWWPLSRTHAFSCAGVTGGRWAGCSPIAGSRGRCGECRRSGAGAAWSPLRAGRSNHL